MPAPRLIDTLATPALALPADASLAAELAAGLLARPAAVSPKFFYDRLGSALFTAITELPEYYPTRTERALLAAQAGTIATAVRARLGVGYTLLDLGAGDGAKAATLFEVLRPARYVAVDISGDYLLAALQGLAQRFAAIEMVGVVQDFSARLALPAGLVDAPALAFYPGSSISNFSPDAAVRLLAELRGAVHGGALLIGVDLVKPVAVLQAAYDDALGVTAAFNRNLLRQANRLLGSDFDLADWAHRALFNADASRIEMHLEARRDLQVTWPGLAQPRAFAAGERIHTENSYKWTPASFEGLLRDAGWAPQQHWTDATGEGFGVFLAHG
jgi:dimethylhistidine N-methyltransferase